MASTYLTRTPSSDGNLKIMTFSFWMKRSNLTSNAQRIFSINENGGADQFWLRTADSSNDYIDFFSQTSSSQTLRLVSNARLRDTSGWYHIVIAVDTTQATDSNRIKMYINGVQQTSFSTTSYPSQNTDLEWNKSVPNIIGKNVSSEYFDGLLSHVHFIDGTAYDASAFGETDATTGEWKAKTSPSVTYGTNGFLILKDGNTITDQSSNSNDFTLGGGTLTDLKDNPDNVFATFNPLLDVNAKPTLSNGNTTMTGAAISSAQFAGSTICVSNGKWYFEAKVTPNSSSPYVGVIDAQSNLRRNANYFVHTASGTNQSGYAVNMSGDIYHNNSNSYAANIGSISSGDILGFAIDLDSAQRTCEIYKNGASQRSFNLDEPTSGAYMLGCCSSYNTASASVNFGNGFFGTTAITTNSGNGYSGAEGSSKFNYTVPAGYSALSTKGLNE